MEVHRRTWHCLNLFRPPYVCGQCHKTVYLWCMHCEGCGFCLHTLECPVRGRAHPSTDKWLFQKWCQEVDVEEVLTATLPNEPVSGDEELDVLSNPLLASPPGKEVKKKEVQSSDSEVDLFAPPPAAPVPKKKAKGKKVLPKAPPIDPPNPQRRTRSTIPSETTPLGVGDWLTDKDILCWLNQEVCHNEIDEPRAWTLAVIYIKRLSKYMQRVESGERMTNMRWCRRHIFVVNSNDKEGLHWFVCAFDCRVRLELFTIWVWEPLSSTHLIRPFLSALKKLSRTTKHRALGFQTDGWSCGFQSLNIAKQVVEHRGTFSNVPLVPMGAGFVHYVLNIVNADRAVRVAQAPGDDVEGVIELAGPPESPPSTQVEGALSAKEDSVQATPTPLEGKEASAEQSVESPEARPQPSVDTPTEEEDTRPKVLIRGEWRKVPDGYPADASGQLERDQLFIDDLCKQLVAELRAACQLNANPGAKPKSGDTKTDLIYKRAFCNYL